MLLITGCAGYIGSHTCVALLEADCEVVVVDNLSNSKAEVIEKIENLSGKKVTIYKYDVTEESDLEPVFEKHQIEGVIHFAGYKAVGESVEKPLQYYYKSIVSTIMLAKACQKYGVDKFVFSSSASVYGENKVPSVETMDLIKTTNPYGETKVICERSISDFAAFNGLFPLALLRYFDQIGAHESGLIGDKTQVIPNNIMPYIIGVAESKLEKLNIFGDDYPTRDGTGVRDLFM